MHVFLSWSGDQSKAIAAAFHPWLKNVVQAAKPFFSPEDIAKGAFWFSELDEHLKSASMGLLFITPGNKNRPWLLFEAGALATRFGKPCVVPILFGLEPSELTGPLPAMNAAPFTKGDIRKVVKVVNECVDEDRRVEPGALDEVFDLWWPKLESAVHAAIEAHPERPRAKDPLKHLDRAKELIGWWKGTLHYDTASSASGFKLPLRVRFEFRDGSIEGLGEYRVRHEGETHDEELVLMHLEMPHEGLFQMTYHNRMPNTEELGGFTARLDPSNRSMTGRVVGFGVRSKQFISGDLMFKKWFGAEPPELEAVDFIPAVS
jgi:hypothetical protein